MGEDEKRNACVFLKLELTFAGLNSRESDNNDNNKISNRLINIRLT